MTLHLSIGVAWQAEFGCSKEIDEINPLIEGKIERTAGLGLQGFMSKAGVSGTRRHERISLPKGMSVSWYGAGQQRDSRVKTLSMGGMFLMGSYTAPVGTQLRLIFEVPGGFVQAEAVVRSVTPGEGMGVEFTKLNPQDQVLLEKLMKRLLR